MKAAVFFAVLALLVPLCLAFCDPSRAPVHEDPASSVGYPCMNGSMPYLCNAESACDGKGACKTCLNRVDGFKWVNIQGTACCNIAVAIGAYLWGDPHLTGFDGNKFDFQGIHNKWFNLLSTEYLQLNGFFQPTCGQNGTHVTEIGLLVNGSRIHLSADSSTLDNNELTCCHGWTPVPLNGGVLRHQWVNHFEVETEHFLIKVTHIMKNEERECIKAAFNLEFKLKDYHGAIHGVIGQTAHHPLSGDAPEVEGKTEDYVVSAPFATDSLFNRYDL